MSYTWRKLNEVLALLPETDVKALLDSEVAGAKRVKTYRLEVLKDVQKGDTRIISGTPVNKEGVATGPANVEEIEILVGVQEVIPLVFDWKYGELVVDGTATQQNGEYS